MGNQQPSIILQQPRPGYGFIYEYTSPSQKKYIGKTIQTLSERARHGKGYSMCTVFYKAIQKYGFNNLEVRILEEIEEHRLDEREQYWIEKMNTLVPNGYNLSNGGKGRSKTIYQYNLNGKYLATYYSIKTAAQLNSFNSYLPICDCVNGKTTSAYNYIWTDQYVEAMPPQLPNYHQSTRVYAYDADGNFVGQFDNYSEASRATNTNRNSIRYCIQGKYRMANNLIWKDTYYEKLPPTDYRQNGQKAVCQLNKDTEEIIAIYPSQSAAARALGLKKAASINNCIQGRTHSAAGYKWKYYEGSTTMDSKISEAAQDPLI